MADTIAIYFIVTHIFCVLSEDVHTSGQRNTKSSSSKSNYVSRKVECLGEGGKQF